MWTAAEKVQEKSAAAARADKSVTTELLKVGSQVGWLGPGRVPRLRMKVKQQRQLKPHS